MKKIFAVPILLMFLVASCSLLQNVKPWGERTSQEKSISFMQFYNSEYRDTMAMVTNPASTPDQKKMAMTKKAILKQLWPLIGAYDSYASGGPLFSPTLEQQILALISKLGGQLK